MSRKTRHLRDEADRRWPQLSQFLGGYCHEDWRDFHGTPERAIEAGIRDYTLEMKQRTLQEWRDWSASTGSADDIRASVNDGFRVNVFFKTSDEAREFMDTVHNKLLASVKSDTTPSAKSE